MATASAGGQPYVQHRGGPRSFLKVLDDRTLAFADYAGNQQYICIDNLRENSSAFIFLMDYPDRTRIKLWGDAEFVENDPDLMQLLIDPEYKARPQRALAFHLKAWDVNCNQHIRQRFAADEQSPRGPRLQRRIEQLEDQLHAAGLQPVG